MAIQFNCVSCQKAIEVADEWSCRLVECPYCGDTITAPGISQTPVRPAVPRATPASDFAGSTPQPAYQSAPQAYETRDFELVAPRKQFDGLALAGLLFCLASMVLYGVATVLFVTAIFERVGPNATQEQLEAFAKEVSEDPPAWATKMLMLGLLAFGVWLVGAIMSVIAFVRNRKDPRGKLAFWALLLSSYLPLLMLLGLLIQQ